MSVKIPVSRGFAADAPSAPAKPSWLAMPGARLTLRIATGLAALAFVGLGAWLLLHLTGLDAAGGTAAPKNPFGTGLREAAPSATGIGIGGLILSVQAHFYQMLRDALAGLKTGGGLGPLVAIGFAYGVFHAAGPGHGKGVISGYLVASRRTLKRGLVLSLLAALLQALVAILIVGILAIALNATARTISNTADMIERVSFAAVVLFGAVLLWRKTGQVLAIFDPPDAHDANCGPDCGHLHLPEPSAVSRMKGIRDAAGIVVAAGIRPCSGAIILLVFALSQGLVWAGIGAVVAMALGTAITTGAIATLAVFVKSAALRLTGEQSRAGLLALAGLEVLAAAFVLMLGLSLLAGIASGLGA
jgi:ABC-type nickel/cobalt efflux system permease component RcnA